MFFLREFCESFYLFKRDRFASNVLLSVLSERVDDVALIRSERTASVCACFHLISALMGHTASTPIGGHHSGVMRRV